MKRFDYLPVVLLLPMLGFVAYQATDAPSRITEMTQGAVHGADTTAKVAIARAMDDVKEPVEARSNSRHDAADIRRRLERSQGGTYIAEVLRQRDSSLARWPERLSEPVRIWIADGSAIDGWSSVFGDRVQNAFDEWSRIGIPVRFTFVRDSAEADVHVGWIHHFGEPISGKTLWARDRQWWIVDGSITLALHHNGGERLDGAAVRAIALHEVGHLLGLDHTADTANIMTPRVRVRDLSESDRATIRLLYSLPPGSLR